MKNALRIFLVEDNSIIRATLAMFLEKKGFEVIGEAGEAEVAWPLMQEVQFDLAILDIDLAGEKDGIWLAKQIRSGLEVPFVYLTAFGDDCTMKKIMDTSPNGYLMKPFKEPDIFSAVHIAIDNFSRQKTASPMLSEQPKSDNVILKDSIFIKEKGMLVRLKIGEIKFMKSEGNYVEIVLDSGKYLMRDKLVNVLKRLPKNQFLQVHLRYVINIERIASIGQGFLMIGDDKIAVSKTFANNLMSRLEL